MFASLKRRYYELQDLREWRDWLIDVLTLIYVFVFPIAMIFLFPVFILHGHYVLIVIDGFVWLLMVVRSFIPSLGYRFRSLFWILLLYTLTITFYILRGPGYTRSAWLFSCVIMAALFFGSRAAVISVIANAGLLMLLFFIMRDISSPWSAAAGDGLMNWMIFVMNFSLLSLMASLPVGFMIKRLDMQLVNNRLGKEELQEAMEKLRRETAFAETMLDTLPGIFFMLNREGRFVRWKGQTKNENPFGYTNDEIKNMTAGDFLDEGEAGFFSRLIERVLTEGSGIAELVVRSKSGKRYCYYLSGSRMIIGDEVFIIGIGIDITDRKRAEEERERVREQLVQAQKLEAVGSLAGGIAHDFNNMLVGIMGGVNMAEMLLREDGPVDIKAVLGYLETAADSSLRAADMTRGLLTLSRKSGLKIASVDMHLCMMHLLKLCKNSLPKTVELDFIIGDEPLMVRADPLQVEQVLLNLCVNASHAMTMMRREGERQGGRLRLDAAPMRCDADFSALHAEARTGDAYVKIRVSDNGVGMDGETRRHIFDPFFTTKGSGEGTGLGLSMAYSIIKQHHGFIDVYSEPGKGSTFTVYIPAAEGAEESAVGGPKRPAIVEGTGTILVIDDEQAILRIASGMLQRCGYRVITADCGDDGVEQYRENAGEISAVLLDYSLPGGSGLEIFKRLREIDPGVRVLLTSGLMEEDIMKKALSLGIGSFIQKPYTVQELSVRINEVIG